jgi:hypothetical protein
MNNNSTARTAAQRLAYGLIAQDVLADTIADRLPLRKFRTTP